MNRETEFFEMSFYDLFREAGSTGLIAFWLTVGLVIIGLKGIKLRLTVAWCYAYSLMVLLPFVIGFYGVADHLMMVLRDASGHVRPEVLQRFISSGEAFMPMMIGCIGSAILMLVASLLWRSVPKTPFPQITSPSDS